ncbi:MAG TPA: SusC/RagA family TonB-linked outer membrane protein, partial [Balneolaceae bacterium]|nr:SusC/RagA family TonB-linked outer membrane protein [Balneolaceae bacterium]
NNTLTYKKQFNNQSIKVLGGFSYQKQKDNTLSASAYGFPSDFYKYNNLGLGTNPQAPSSGASKWTLISYFARLHYILANKYILTASYRIDGNSKFGANNKYGTFPSVSAAWKLGNEKFIKNLNLFSHLKLRFGYGQTGDAEIGTYQSLSSISTSNGQFGAYAYNGKQVPIAYPNGIANPDLSWEKTKEFNYGLDMGFVNDRLTISANYYDKKTTAMLLNQPIPRQSGFSSVLDNIGKMRNTGVEVQISSENVVSKSFNWNTSFNISGNRNKVLSLGGTNYIYTGWGIYAGNYIHGSHVTRIQVGHSVSNFYGVVYDGLWKSKKQIKNVGTMPSATPGSIRYKDLNGDGTWSPNKDSKFLGTASPKFQFGLTNNFSYKNFDLHVFIYGEYGNKVYDIPLEHTLYNGSGLSAKRVKKRWTPQSPNNPYPAANSGSMFTINSADVVDASFLRFKNVTLTYHIPVSKRNNNGIFRKASIGVSVDNLAVITSYPGYDPEVNSFGGGHSPNKTKGVDRYAYPASRTIRFNLNLGF